MRKVHDATVRTYVRVCIYKYYLHTASKRLVILNLCTEYEISKLSVCKEDDEENHAEAENVFSTLQ